MKKLFLAILLLVAPVRAGVEFDGVNDYIRASPGDIRSTGSMSVWFFADSAAANEGVCCFGNSANNANAIEIAWRNGTEIQCTYRYSFTNKEVYAALALSTWHHVAFTWDSSYVTLFTNGVQAGQVAQGTIITASLDQFAIGSEAKSTFVDVFDGLISEVQIYNRALSATEVELIAKSRIKGPKFSGLIHYWPLDDVADGASGSGATYQDRAGTANGTGTNGTVGRAETYLSYP